MKRRGYLIVSLLLLTLVLLICLGMLLRQPANYDRATRRLESLQARGLALSGIENVRVQVDHDYLRLQQGEAGLATYMELVRDPQTGGLVGAYKVTLDRRWEGTPTNYGGLKARACWVHH